MGLDLGILVKLREFLIIMILCLIFAELYLEDLIFWILLFVKYFLEFSQWQRYILFLFTKNCRIKQCFLVLKMQYTKMDDTPCDKVLRTTHHMPYFKL